MTKYEGGRLKAEHLPQTVLEQRQFRRHQRPDFPANSPFVDGAELIADRFAVASLRPDGDDDRRSLARAVRERDDDHCSANLIDAGQGYDDAGTRFFDFGPARI